MSRNLQIERMRSDKDHLLQLFMVKEVITTGFPLSESELQALAERKKQIETNIKKILFRDDNVYEDMLKELEDELREVRNSINMQSQRESIIKRDKETFDRYLKELDEVDVDNLDNAVLKRLFYKIRLVDMSHYREGMDEPQRGLMFDYYFLQMPYSELVKSAANKGYPHMEELPIDIMPF